MEQGEIDREDTLSPMSSLSAARLTFYKWVGGWQKDQRWHDRMQLAVPVNRRQLGDGLE